MRRYARAITVTAFALGLAGGAAAPVIAAATSSAQVAQADSPGVYYHA